MKNLRRCGRQTRSIHEKNKSQNLAHLPTSTRDIMCEICLRSINDRIFSQQTRANVRQWIKLLFLNFSSSILVWLSISQRWTSGGDANHVQCTFYSGRCRLGRSLNVISWKSNIEKEKTKSKYRTENVKMDKVSIQIFTVWMMISFLSSTVKFLRNSINAERARKKPKSIESSMTFYGSQLPFNAEAIALRPHGA